MLFHTLMNKRIYIIHITIHGTSCFDISGYLLSEFFKHPISTIFDQCESSLPIYAKSQACLNLVQWFQKRDQNMKRAPRSREPREKTRCYSEYL